MTKSVFRQETGENIVWCRKRGQKCVARSLRFLCAHGAHSCVLLCKGLLSWFRKYRKRYFPHNKKEPCDRVRIGCAFALLIWLCLKQGSLLQRTLRSGSYRVRFCTFDLVVFEAMKHRLRGEQAAQGMCEVQIVWIICTSSIPAGTVWTNAVSIFYNDSIALVNYLLKFC